MNMIKSAVAVLATVLAFSTVGCAADTTDEKTDDSKQETKKDDDVRVQLQQGSDDAKPTSRFCEVWMSLSADEQKSFDGTVTATKGAGCTS